MVDEAVCQFCGKKYRRFRSDGKFCSDSHRVQFGQLPAKLKAKADRAIDLIAQMRELVEQYPHLLAQCDTELLNVQQKATTEWVRLSQLTDSQKTGVK